MTTNRAPSAIPPLSLTDPVWRVEHVAACCGVSTETALQYASRLDFPPSRQVAVSAGRLLWLRDDVIAWVTALPARTAADRRRTTAAIESGASEPSVRPYRSRSRRAAS